MHKHGGAESPLLAAALAGDLNTLQHCLQSNEAIDACDKAGNSALMLAAYTGHLESVKYLIKQGANLQARNNNGYNSLMIATFGKQAEVVYFFLSHYRSAYSAEDVDKCCVIAAFFGHLELLQMLYHHFAGNLNAEDRPFTPLVCAVMLGHTAVSDWLLAHGAQKQLRTTLGETALSYARMFRQDDMIQRLMPEDTGPGPRTL